MVQLGPLALQVVPEGLLQCRTQHWNTTGPTNTDRGEKKREREGGKGGKEGGKEEGKER